MDYAAKIRRLEEDNVRLRREMETIREEVFRRIESLRYPEEAYEQFADNTTDMIAPDNGPLATCCRQTAFRHTRVGSMRVSLS